MASAVDHYDYVIVGAGSSGATLAGRLSENAAATVLLLEAGPDYRSADTIEAIRSRVMAPILDASLYPDYHWVGLTACRNAAQEARPYIRGRGVGGSSAINGQYAVRPPLEDFDNWAAEGCTGWSGADVLPTFIRIEDDLMFGDEPYHGVGGPIPIFREPVENWTAADRAIREAAAGCGHAWEPDINAPGTTGCGWYPYNSRDGVRVSTNDAYLDPARDRANLVVRGATLVDSVIFEGAKAVGVSLIGPSGPEQVRGSTIILSAGTVGSPAILQRSGVGPNAVLRDLGIPVVADLPVGEGFQDHSSVGIFVPLRDEALAADRPVVIVRYTSGEPRTGINDMFILTHATGHFAIEGGSPGPSLTFRPATFQSLSRGTLRIASRDATALPLIDMNLLAEEGDRKRLREGVGRALELSEHPAVRQIAGGRAHGLDGTDVAALATDADLDRWANHAVVDTAHATSTCRMGAPDAESTVVDPTCSVLGIDNLRVVDASVFPAVVRANTNLTAIMVAEHVVHAL